MCSASVCIGNSLTSTRQCNTRQCNILLISNLPLSLSSPTSFRTLLTMSGSSSSSKPSASSSNFQSIFNAALKAYEKKTKSDLLAHPLAAQLQACSSPNDIFSILQDKLNEFDQSRSRDERLSRWLNPTINILLAFSATLSEGVGLVCSN